MIHYPDPYDHLMDEIQQRPHAFEVAVHVGTYIDITEAPDKWSRESQILQLTTTESMFGAGNPCIGSAVSRSLTLRGRDIDIPSIPISGEIISIRYPVWVATRIIDTTGLYDVPGWYTQGPWWMTQEPQRDLLTGVITVQAYDAIAESDVEYMTIPEGQLGNLRNCYANGTTSETVANVFADVAGIIGLSGVTQRAAAAITAAGNPSLPVPDDTVTCRDILRWIAGICGGNAMVQWSDTSSGLLDIVPFNFAGETITVSSNMSSLKTGGRSNSNAYWDVCFETDNGDITSTHNSGDYVTTRFQMENPLGTVALADHALDVIRQRAETTDVPWRYQGYQARDAVLDIRAQVGDRVLIEYPTTGGVTQGFASLIGEIQRTYDVACLASVSAPDMARVVAQTWDDGSSS